jgi:hypothetical protein
MSVIQVNDKKFQPYIPAGDIHQPGLLETCCFCHAFSILKS